MILLQTPAWNTRDGNENLSRLWQTKSAPHYQSPHLAWDFQASPRTLKNTLQSLLKALQDRVKTAPWEYWSRCACTKPASSLNNSSEHRPAAFLSLHCNLCGVRCLWCTHPPESCFGGNLDQLNSGPQTLIGKTLLFSCLLTVIFWLREFSEQQTQGNREAWRK